MIKHIFSRTKTFWDGAQQSLKPGLTSIRPLYFDQHLSAAHSKRLSKNPFIHTFAQKIKRGRKSKNPNSDQRLFEWLNMWGAVVL